jgi:mono/diheme cytochrome c family protein
VLATLVIALVVAMFVAASGSVSVGADIRPGLIEGSLAPWIKDRSVQRHAPKVKNPLEGNANAIAAGMSHYREHCLACHGAPGLPATEVAQGLNPPAPSLGREENDTPDGELFWVTKHGIRFTSMPAFGPTHSDQEIWEMVAFLRHLPELTANEKRYLREASDCDDTQPDEHAHAGG